MRGAKRTANRDVRIDLEAAEAAPEASEAEEEEADGGEDEEGGGMATRGPHPDRCATVCPKPPELPLSDRCMLTVLVHL